MSYYLCFKKGGVQIYNSCRCTRLYGAFQNAPWDKWEKMAITEFENARHKLIRDRESLEDSKDTYIQIFESETNRESKFELIDAIKEFTRDIKEIDTTLIQIDMLEDIWREGEYSEDEAKRANVGLEWGIF
jgi:hypothetical protein